MFARTHTARGYSPGVREIALYTWSESLDWIGSLIRTGASHALPFQRSAQISSPLKAFVGSSPAQTIHFASSRSTASRGNFVSTGVGRIWGWDHVPAASLENSSRSGVG